VNELLLQLLRAQVYRFIGRCGATPEVKYFQSGAAVANVNIAINQPDAKKDDGKPADWIRLEVWGAEQAQAFADACQKGTLVDVSGRVRSNTYTDRNNETKSQLVMKVEQWAPANSSQQQTQPAATARPAPTAAAPAPTAWATSNDSDAALPF
jgi:single-strand DNA-binding protein